jgi:hypothetical protein
MYVFVINLFVMLWYFALYYKERISRCGLLKESTLVSLKCDMSLHNLQGFLHLFTDFYCSEVTFYVPEFVIMTWYCIRFMQKLFKIFTSLTKIFYWNILIAGKVSIMVFWVMTVFNLVGGYQHSGGMYSLHLQGTSTLTPRTPQLTFFCRFATTQSLLFGSSTFCTCQCIAGKFAELGMNGIIHFIINFVCSVLTLRE